MLFGLTRRVRVSSGHLSRHVFFCDNMSVALCLEKGRCADPRLLYLCRRWAALLLATGSRSRVRWIASEFNPSDAASRWFLPRGWFTEKRLDPARPVLDLATMQGVQRHARKACAHPGRFSSDVATVDMLRGGASIILCAVAAHWCALRGDWSEHASRVAAPHRTLARAAEPAITAGWLRGGGGRLARTCQPHRRAHRLP